MARRYKRWSGTRGGTCSIRFSQHRNGRRGAHHKEPSVYFFLKRHTGYFMLQVYVPCGLIVSCSWVSFWIDPDAVPARVSLGVTTVLSMTTMGFGGRSQMPKVSYATALDWFVILCFSFVFAVMVEYAAINFIDKLRTDLKRKKEEQKKKREAEEAKEAKEMGEEEDEEERKKRKKMEGGKGGEEPEEGKIPESNMVLGGVGEHEIVRVIVETVGEEPVESGHVERKFKEPIPEIVAPATVTGMGRIMPSNKDNIEWEDSGEEYEDDEEEELDVVGNGAGPEEVVEVSRDISRNPTLLGPCGEMAPAARA
ncbi:hypothetical protein J437_LFUL000025 [Ladona fulva]|uniref:Neurotransmitter-gated ion-channel transmembrane domain-containing protein n=1 Tax=Ladona fulva TaxID=123851 RepID=A0A8K0JYM6_LADFU|nr:hypothetical protein J437_LFUL000025 [Ladona fulva]